MAEETKEVQGYFGKPVRKTKAEFISAWRAQISECYELCDTVEEGDELRKMQDRIEQLAGRKWDRIK